MQYDEESKLSFKSTPEVMCTIQNSSIIICAVTGFAAIFALEFVLVPLILAYFVTFLMAPMMDLMEKRPYDGIPKTVLCKNKYADDFWWAHDGDSYFEKLSQDYNVEGEWVFPSKEERVGRQRMTQAEWDEAKDRGALDGSSKFIVDCTTSFKFPHMAACAFTLIGWVAMVYGAVWLLSSNFEAFTAADRHEACKNSPGWENFDKNLFADPKNGVSDEKKLILECDAECTLESDLVIADMALNGFGSSENCRCCTTANAVSDKVNPNDDTGEEIKTTGDRSIQFMWTRFLNEQMDYLEVEMGIFIFRELICPKKDVSNVNVTSTFQDGYVDFVFSGVESMREQQGSWDTKTAECARQDVFPRNPDGQTWEQFGGSLSFVGVLLSDLVLVLMLAVFILLERPEGSTISGDHIMMMQIESMVKNYISLKTLLSFMTGVLCAIALEGCGVKMGIIFGFLSFLLNFVPMIGSVIAICLPLPIIVLDENVQGMSKTLAILIPTAIQGYVGNFLEPAVFGKSLNLTAIAVLLGLVVFGALWGLAGAVLSVPLLGAFKIVMHHTDHPIAKYSLLMIREDNNMP